MGEREPGEKLRELRLSAGVSQRLLAEQSGVDQSAISRIERGGDARWGTLKKLFGALGHPIGLSIDGACDEAECLLQDLMQERRDRMEYGRGMRW